MAKGIRQRIAQIRRQEGPIRPKGSITPTEENRIWEEGEDNPSIMDITNTTKTIKATGKAVEVRALDKDNNSNNRVVSRTKGPDPKTKMKLIATYVEPRAIMPVNARPEKDND